MTSSNASDAFGVGSFTANTASPYQWNAGSGYRTEGVAPSGLSVVHSFQKVGARYYDPALGCFLTRDTELGQKPYVYCDGEPVNFTDPSGHKLKWWQIALKALLGNGISLFFHGSGFTISGGGTYSNKGTYSNGHGGYQQQDIQVTKRSTINFTFPTFGIDEGK